MSYRTTLSDATDIYTDAAADGRDFWVTIDRGGDFDTTTSRETADRTPFAEHVEAFDPSEYDRDQLAESVQRLFDEADALYSTRQ